LASEYYDTLPYHRSWPLVTWKFVMDPQVGVWNRVKRHAVAKRSLLKEE
jgi:sphingolipid delta-4 desaturase